MCDLLEYCCKSLEITQSFKGCFAGPKNTEFSVLVESIEYRVTIDQQLKRVYSIEASDLVKIDQIWDVFLGVEDLLMIMDGRFYPITDVRIIEADCTDTECNTISKSLISRRLYSRESSDCFNYRCNRLIDYSKVFDNELVDKWFSIRDELDIVHPMFTYIVADTGITKDVRCAFMIELFEPLSELISEYNTFFPNLEHDNKRPFLRECLDAVICKYGNDIFGSEYSANHQGFLSVLVNTRKRIMHIKRKMKDEKYLSGEESALYLVKLYFLYRIVVLSLLGIEYSLYKSEIVNAVEIWNEWQGTLDSFIKTKL